MERVKYLVASFILVLSLILGAGCTLLPDIDISPLSNSSPSQITAPTDPNWTPPPAESNAPVLPDFVTVVDKVKPSVVAVNTVTYDVFDRRQEGAGSGWIISEDGHIVTNNHVVQGAESITVTLDDGRTFQAGIVGSDALTDLAVLKIDAEDLVKASRGDSSELDVGEWVLAIGNSLGLGVTPSEGIVRSLGASVTVSPGQTLDDLIGTSTPINPSNSGGPLVNMRGEVIGIASMKIAMVGVEAMGWAISINSAMPIITELINHGYVIRPYIGIGYGDVTPYLVWRYDLPVSEGIFVAEVISGYPADKAGLKSGDIIVGFNGKEITNTGDLRLAITSCEIGDEVKITYWRGDTKKTTYATLVESPPPT